MTERVASLEELALRLMCRPESIPKHVIEAMSGEDLSQVLEWAMEHRFAPCLHYNMGKAGLLPRLPAEMRDRLAIAYQRATLRGLSMQRDMIRTSRILEQAGIAHLFMKGAYVAQFAYPELGLRPLRDIDVLVPHAQAIAGFEALQANGLGRKPGHPGDPAAHLEDRKHLPPLRIPGGATVEVHTRTISPSQLLRTDSAHGNHETMASRQIRRDVAGCSIPFEGTEDLLLHLAVHAAIDHQFNNGPLIVSDIGWLLETHAISWPRLWQLASAQEQRVAWHWYCGWLSGSGQMPASSGTLRPQASWHLRTRSSPLLRAACCGASKRAATLPCRRSWPDNCPLPRGSASFSDGPFRAVPTSRPRCRYQQPRPG